MAFRLAAGTVQVSFSEGFDDMLLEDGCPPGTRTWREAGYVDGDETFYVIRAESAFEEGRGVFRTDPDRLVRSTVSESTGGPFASLMGNVVSFWSYQNNISLTANAYYGPLGEANGAFLVTKNNVGGGSPHVLGQNTGGIAISRTHGAYGDAATFIMSGCFAKSPTALTENSVRIVQLGVSGPFSNTAKVSPTNFAWIDLDVVEGVLIVNSHPDAAHSNGVPYSFGTWTGSGVNSYCIPLGSDWHYVDFEFGMSAAATDTVVWPYIMLDPADVGGGLVSGDSVLMQDIRFEQKWYGANGFTVEYSPRHYHLAQGGSIHFPDDTLFTTTYLGGGGGRSTESASRTFTAVKTYAKDANTATYRITARFKVGQNDVSYLLPQSDTGLYVGFGLESAAGGKYLVNVRASDGTVANTVTEGSFINGTSSVEMEAGGWLKLIVQATSDTSTMLHVLSQLTAEPVFLNTVGSPGMRLKDYSIQVLSTSTDYGPRVNFPPGEKIVEPVGDDLPWDETSIGASGLGNVSLQNTDNIRITTLNVSSWANVGGNVSIGGNANVILNLGVGGNANVIGNFGVNGSANVILNLGVGGNTSVTGNVYVGGAVHSGTNTQASYYGGSYLMMRREADYTYVYSPDGVTNPIIMGHPSIDNNMYFRNRQFIFQNTTGSDVSAQINSVGTFIRTGTLATNTTTGALVVNGGVGISSDLYVGGGVILPNGTVHPVNVRVGSSLGNSVYQEGGIYLSNSTTRNIYQWGNTYTIITGPNDTNANTSISVGSAPYDTSIYYNAQRHLLGLAGGNFRVALLVDTNGYNLGNSTAAITANTYDTAPGIRFAQTSQHSIWTEYDQRTNNGIGPGPGGSWGPAYTGISGPHYAGVSTTNTPRMYLGAQHYDNKIYYQANIHQFSSTAGGIHFTSNATVVRVNHTTAATAHNTGALQVAGGLGVSERAFIATSLNVGSGYNSINRTIHLGGGDHYIGHGTNVGTEMWAVGAEQSQSFRMIWYTPLNSTGYKMILSNAGELSTATGVLGTISDIRYKKNVVPLDVTWGLDLIKKLSLIEYTPTLQSDDTKRVPGVIAQELKKLRPELVFETGQVEGQDEDGKATGHKDAMAVNYIGLGIVALKAIKELSEENDELKKMMQKMMGRIDELERERKANG
jgi:hypothetical protein